jgi:thiamine-phosphate pyrophosphorylase
VSPTGAGALPRLHIVSDDATLALPDWVSRASEVLSAGGARVALHLRGPRTPGRRLYALAHALVPEAERSGALLVVNDRIDVALAGAVSAIHLGRRSLAPSEARRLLGSGARIGVSCHSRAEVEVARAEGANWLFAGTVYPTPSHPESTGRGVGWLASVVRHAGATPVVAIGGMRPDTVREVLGAGAAGAAVLRGIWEAPDPLRSLAEYIEGLYGREHPPGGQTW